MNKIAERIDHAGRWLCDHGHYRAAWALWNTARFWPPFQRLVRERWHQNNAWLN